MAVSPLPSAPKAERSQALDDLIMGVSLDLPGVYPYRRV